jgi:hypothetical protein
MTDATDLMRLVEAMSARLSEVEVAMREIPSLKSAVQNADGRIDDLAVSGADVGRAIRELGEMYARSITQFNTMLQTQREEHRGMLQTQEERNRVVLEGMQKQLIEFHERSVQDIMSKLTVAVVRTTMETITHWALPSLLAGAVFAVGWLFHLFFAL